MNGSIKSVDDVIVRIFIFDNWPISPMLKVAVSSEVVKLIVASRISNYFPPQAEKAVLDLTRLLSCLEASRAILTS